TLLTMLAEQMTRAPPPFADPLHWLTLTECVELIVPVAVQVRRTRVPPFADPLHCVTRAPEVVAGNGSQPDVIPPPEPTHSLTVPAVECGLTPTHVFVTRTLQRSVPPPPLIESLHWVTRVTRRLMSQTFVLQLACGW